MVDILLSTYNGERYLREQLDSVLAQTFADWRLIIRDDGSLDGTMPLLQEYADRYPDRIRLLTDGDRLGACRSFGRLLEQCGDAGYYAFCDQDDVWKPDKLALSMEVMTGAEAAHPGKPVVVHTDLQVVDERLNEICPSFWKYTHLCPDLQDKHLPYLAISNSVTGCAMLFNGKARACALPMSGKAGMHDAWVALAAAARGGKIIPIHQSLVAYRQHGCNTLGAVPYSMATRSWKERRREARSNYERTHPLVFASKLHFYVWKAVYLLHRTVYGMKWD